MIAKLKSLWSNSFLRFLVIGMINTLWGYGLFAIFVALGMPKEFSLLLSTIMGVIFNFFTTGRLVFRVQGAGFFGRFLFLYGALYLLNLALLEGMEVFRFADLPENQQTILRQGILLPVMVLLSFILNKTFVFRKTKVTKREPQDQRLS